MLSKQDEDQLNLLGILFYLYAGFVGLLALIFAGMAILPVILLEVAPPSHGRAGDAPPWLAEGILFGIFGAVAILFLTKAIVMIFAGRALGRRTNHMLCLVGACLAVVNMPFGTALGIFTVILLQKPAVKARFGVS